MLQSFRFLLASCLLLLFTHFYSFCRSNLFNSLLFFRLASEIGTLFLVRRRLQEMYDDEENRRKIRNNSATSTSIAPKGEVCCDFIIYAPLFAILISCQCYTYPF